ncbi:putative phage abortive infection protein [Klebsiella michiganensis]|uniref:putative phage abortive infection protein n=1 Tax=Klebsiella michiganensis TaxID=1134687 RepID=UPI003F91A5FF
MDDLIISIFYYIVAILNFIWDHGSALIAGFAAWATWRAAKEASRSADIARQSMEKSTHLANKTLTETQNFNNKNSFENHYTLLLEQHNLYHQQLCNHIDRKGSRDEPNDMTALFENAITPGYLDNTLDVLTGHQIVSRYMRTLYHLLKFVDEAFYIKDDLRQMKNYTSPLRSAIRNDVLYLIAVNALNVQTNRAKQSGYPRYQKLLHKFDFFEHAVFFFPTEPNRFILTVDEISLIHSNLSLNSSDYIERLRENLLKGVFDPPPLEINSPAVLCLITYDNFLKESMGRAFGSLDKKMISDLENVIEKMMYIYESSYERIKCIHSWEYQKGNGAQWQNCTKKFICKIEHDVSIGKKNIYNNYSFRDPSKTDENNSFIRGETVIDLVGYLIRYRYFYQSVVAFGGRDKLAETLRCKFIQKIRCSESKMSLYKIS